MRAIEVSIIVPALNEADNLPALAQRVALALAGRTWEMLIVDDASIDDTAAVCAALSADYPLQHLFRPRATAGLSGAVLHGMAVAQGQYLVVMDADLQHPPQRIVDLLAALDDLPCDIALGSRYADGGSIVGHWNWLRRLNSTIATLLARPLAGSLRDPMSGFFALRRDTYLQAQPLNPLGYKIALELICKCPVRRICEVPIEFGIRQAGQSKLSLKQHLMYLRHLARLFAHRQAIRRTWPQVVPYATDGIPMTKTRRAA